MTQYSTPALDDQFPLHPQEIRSAALQAASRITGRKLAFADTAADALALAARFETYIKYGAFTEGSGPTQDNGQVSPAAAVAEYALTPEQLAAGTEKLMAAIRAVADPYRDCSCPQCSEARRLRARQIGRCDHCDKPFTGGSPDGGRMRYWCDDHRPDEIGGPAYPADVDAPEPTPLPEIDLVDELAAALAQANSETEPSQYRLWLPDAAAALAVVRARIGNIPAATPAEDVYRALFGNVGAAQ